MISDGEKKTSDVSWLETYPFRKYVCFPFAGKLRNYYFFREWKSPADFWHVFFSEKHLRYSSEKNMSSEQSSHSYLVVFHQIPVVLKYLRNIIVRLLSCELASPSDVTEVNKYTPIFASIVPYLREFGQ